VKRTIGVHIGESASLVGNLHHDGAGGRERAAFAYAETWISSRDAFPLEPTLPLVQGPQFPTIGSGGSVFHGVIADTEPDGWARQVILRDHAKQRQAARQTGSTAPPALLSAIDFLLAVDDFSRVGAMRFRDEAGIFCRATEPGRRTAPPLVELRHLLAASRAVETSTETAADLQYLRGRGTSLGGLRPKCSVIDDDGQLAIGKFPSVTDQRSVTKGEILALQLARQAGLNAANARLIESDGAPIALIRRFDRTPDGRRIPYASAATLIGSPAGDGREHFYTEIVDAIRQHGAAAREDIEELWRRLVFSILITNADDHLRNHGFLHSGHGLWRLAPAFDINPFPDRMRELKTWPGEETGPSATVDAALAVRDSFGLSRNRGLEILRETEMAVADWQREAKMLGMSKRDIDSFADAFEHPEREAARRATGL
jgi:serine/threonine-protein kinase HipA